MYALLLSENTEKRRKKLLTDMKFDHAAYFSVLLKSSQEFTSLLLTLVIKISSVMTLWEVLGDGNVTSCNGSNLQ